MRDDLARLLRNAGKINVYDHDLCNELLTTCHDELFIDVLYCDYVHCNFIRIGLRSLIMIRSVCEGSISMGAVGLK